MNDDVITQLKETIGILGNKIHSISMKNTTTPFMLYAAYKTVDNDADMDAFIKKVYDFIASYKSNTAYTDILQSSTTTQESVQERLAYWNKMI